MSDLFSVLSRFNSPVPIQSSPYCCFWAPANLEYTTIFVMISFHQTYQICLFISEKENLDLLKT